LKEGGWSQYSITLPSLKKLTKAVSYFELGKAVDKANDDYEINLLRKENQYAKCLPFRNLQQNNRSRETLKICSRCPSSYDS